MKDTGKVESCRVAAAEKIVFISMFFSILIDRVLQSFNCIIWQIKLEKWKTIKLRLMKKNPNIKHGTW